MSATIECAALCKFSPAKPLALPETAIFQLATVFPNYFPAADGQYYPLSRDSVRGILPSLRSVISRATRERSVTGIEMAILPDTSQDMDKDEFTFDPDTSDFYCKICYSEMANQYFQCDGCMKRPHQEFNICWDCFGHRRYLLNVMMRPETKVNKLSSDCHHKAERKHKCDTNCSQGNYSEYCCHTKFTRHLRLYSNEVVSLMIPNCELIPGGEEEVLYAKETVLRLTDCGG